MFGSCVILKSFDCKIGNIFKFSGISLIPGQKIRENKMNYEDIVLAVIIVKTLLVIY
jgi:hypothetical protein